MDSSAIENNREELAKFFHRDYMFQNTKKDSIETTKAKLNKEWKDL
jgi:hypothetical protein